MSRPSEAITGLKTPVNPPAPTRLVPLSDTTAHLHIEGDRKLRTEMERIYAEDLKTPELIETLHEAGHALPTIIEAIAKGDMGCLQGKDDLDSSLFPMPDMELMGGFDGARSVAPPPPPRIPGLGRPETTREGWFSRAITWLFSRGEG